MSPILGRLRNWCGQRRPRKVAGSMAADHCCSPNVCLPPPASVCSPTTPPSACSYIIIPRFHVVCPKSTCSFATHTQGRLRHLLAKAMSSSPIRHSFPLLSMSNSSARVTALPLCISFCFSSNSWHSLLSFPLSFPFDGRASATHCLRPKCRTRFLGGHCEPRRVN
jgi:hypothetical protein